MKRLAAFVALFVTGSALAVERLRDFDALAATSDRLTLGGLGHGTSGRFQLDGSAGQFERFTGTARRRSDALALGGLRFRVDASAGRLAGECRQAEEAFGERVAPRVRATTVAMPSRVMCRFTLDGRPSGSLMMGEVWARGITVREDRRGTLWWEGQEPVDVRSIHHFARSPLPAAAPLGYVLARGGTPLAGVDISSDTRVMLLPRDGTRTAALASMTALALMWEADAD